MRLDRLASRLPAAADDPLFLPHLGGRVTPSRPYLRGCWAGLTWSHTAAHLYRAVLEGVALEYCLYRDVLAGAQSGAWDPRDPRHRRRPAERPVEPDQGRRPADCPSCRSRGAKGPRSGAALLAGFGVGLFDDLDAAARRWISHATPRCRRNRRAQPITVSGWIVTEGCWTLMGKWSEPAAGGQP